MKKGRPLVGASGLFFLRAFGSGDFFLIEMPGKLFRADGVDEGIGVCLFYGMHHLTAFIAGNHRVNQFSFIMMEGALSLEDGGSVPAGGIDDRADLIGFVGNNEDRLSLIFLIEHVQRLGGGVLEDDGIQR